MADAGDRHRQPLPEGQLAPPAEVEGGVRALLRDAAAGPLDATAPRSPPPLPRQAPPPRHLAPGRIPCGALHLPPQPPVRGPRPHYLHRRRRLRDRAVGVPALLFGGVGVLMLIVSRVCDGLMMLVLEEWHYCVLCSIEEHYVSILNFSWPQVTCVTQCPIRGSRVVFMSFCDKSKQIQKFAVRFPQFGDAESFLNCVKEFSSDTMDIIPSGSDYVCEDSSASEYIASNGLHHRPDEAVSFEEPASDHRIDVVALGYHEEPNQPVLGPPLATSINSIYSGFPPSFSEMLTNCSTDNRKDEPYPVTATDHAPEEAYILDVSHDVIVACKETTADKEKGAGKETVASKETGDVMAQIRHIWPTTPFMVYSPWIWRLLEKYCRMDIIR